MNIAIVGGGNVGTQLAVHCAEKGHRVIIYSSKPELFEKHLIEVDENQNVVREGDIFAATNDANVAFGDAELIFVTMPAYCMRSVAEKMAPFVRSGIKIGLVPGTGGGECAFRGIVERGAVLFGLQRVPSVARLVEYGKIVCATGYRQELHVASLPSNKAEEIAVVVSQLLGMKCTPMPNYLNLTLTPSNPILHTARLKTIFLNYASGKVYERLPLFYEEWNDESSRLLFKCDAEVQEICQALKEYDLSYVRSLKVHYESDTPEALTKKISSIKGFKGLTTPSVKVEGGYIPDLNSRYFTADFPYGLEIIKQVAFLCGVCVPYIDETLSWYDGIALNKDKYSYADYGIIDKDSFDAFYKM